MNTLKRVVLLAVLFGGIFVARAAQAGDVTGKVSATGLFQTPDPGVDQALLLRVALEQLKILTPILVAATFRDMGRPGTGTRPMHALFFDEPGAGSPWAYLAAGQGEQLREGFRFVQKYQRADGKTPHELYKAPESSIGSKIILTVISPPGFVGLVFNCDGAVLPPDGRPAIHSGKLRVYSQGLSVLRVDPRSGRRSTQHTQGRMGFDGDGLVP